MNHFAAAFEDHPFVDTQTWSKDVTTKNSWMVDLHPVLGMNGSVNLATDDDGACLDGSVDPSAFSDDESVRSIDLPAKRTPNSNSALKTELSFELTTVIDNPGYGVLSGWNT